MTARSARASGFRGRVKTMTVTAVLIGRGGELDRVSFKPRNPEYVTYADLMRTSASEWVIGDGDTIQIIEED